MFVSAKPNMTSMKCTGLGCKEDVDFRVYKKQITSSSGLTVDCDVEKVLSELGSILPANAQVTRSAATLDIQSLCDKCWAKKCVGWGGDMYLTVAAKAASDGVYFNTSRVEYKEDMLADKAMNMRKIRCTVVHEIVHWTVADTTQGFQNAPDVYGMRGSDWDECMTDYLALTTFKRLKWGAYETGYNKLPTFMEIGMTLLKAAPARLFATVGANLQAAFPELNLVIAQPNVQAWQVEVERVRVPLFEKLALRYVKGNDSKVDPGEPATFSAFLQKAFLIQVNNKLNDGSRGKYNNATY
ncbi:MAG: hypothetical protein QFF03_02055 [Pseudomonadota bacterium]|nr:hypothetical protein [Pseudomonadota bacterium]